MHADIRYERKVKRKDKRKEARKQERREGGKEKGMKKQRRKGGGSYGDKRNLYLMHNLQLLFYFWGSSYKTAFKWDHTTCLNVK